MSNFKILVFAGSLRNGSIHKKLAKYSSNELKGLGFEATFVDLSDYPLPIYNGDIKPADFPKNAIILEKLMREYDAWVIASPEYNYSMTGCLKNLIDWVSRAPENKPNMTVFSEKIVALMTMSFGRNSLKHLREILSSLGCFVIPSQVSIDNSSVFDSNNNLVDDANKKAVHRVLSQLTKITSKLL